MSRIQWSTVTRVLGAIVAAGFIGATVLFLLPAVGVLGGPPEPPPEDFIDSVIADFEFQQTVWPVELASTALFALGFGALGALGPVIARLADDRDGRRGLVTAGFLTAGGLGAAAQLIWIGARPIATSTEYCECGLLEEEIMARLMALNIVDGIEMWLTSGAILAISVGLVAAAGIGRERGMSTGWWWLSIVLAALGVFVSVLLPLFDVFPIDLIVVAIVAGVLLPAWAIWLAAAAPSLWGREVVTSAD